MIDVSEGMDIDSDAVVGEIRQRIARVKELRREIDGNFRTSAQAALVRRDLGQNCIQIADLFDVLDGHLTVGGALPLEWQ